MAQLKRRGGLLFAFLAALLAASLIALGFLSDSPLTAPSIDSNATLSSSPEAIARGAALVTAGGCVSCHLAVAEDGSVDDSVLSGGHALVTDFGSFYAPNITPDAATGIGGWVAGDFLRALKHGRSPSGAFYYPAFPYRAYAGLSDQDVLDMGAYLLSLPPVVREVPSHDTPWWLNRAALIAWNLLADSSEGELASFGNEADAAYAAMQSSGDIPQATEEATLIARGAYLARHLGHCGECHTPRSSLGIPRLAQEFEGAQLGDETIEAIDSDALAEWTRESFDLFLLLGMKPDADFVGGDMADVIEHNTSRLSDRDRLALAAFFTR